MRTTITLADDVIAAVERLRRERGAGVSEVVNDLVRRGLTARSTGGVFRQTSTDMGQPSVPFDDVAGLLEALDGPSAR